MVRHQLYFWMLLSVTFFTSAVSFGEQAGGIRGMVRDSDFDAPLAAAKVMIAESGETVTTTDEGNYVFGQIQPGTYTLVFSKEGYTRQVKGNVVVSPGKMTELNISLTGEFEEMEEFVVEDVQIGGGSEAALLELRVESPALLDSVGADLMSKAGAGDAASALNLVSGATVAEGKYAVVRGLPDRYVNSQMNGVRLPTADADKRAVQLDQFPSAVIESIQVSKTFTPDQQGDASGGAVNVVLKGVPDETVFKISSQYSQNSNVENAGSGFLSYKGGGVGTWGLDDGSRDIQADRLGQSWTGAVGVSEGNPPTDWKGSVSFGTKKEFEDFTIGGFGSFFYERNSSFHDNGIDDKYWVLNNDLDRMPFHMTPQYGQGAPDADWNPDDPYNPAQSGDFYTSLFDVTQSSQEVMWGGLGVLGIETENNKLSLLYMHTQTTEDKVTLAEDTRGKEYYFPGYDRNDPTHPGNLNRDAAPYLRLETLEYTERSTQTIQLNGRHTLMDLDLGIENLFTFLRPEIDWTVAHSSANLNQPDKRLFGTEWWGPKFIPGIPRFGIPDQTLPAVHQQYKPGSDFTLGNLQRVWKEISEESNQTIVNIKFPFEQWSGDEGYFKTGFFRDQTDREYDQESFSNFSRVDLGYTGGSYLGPWEDYWSKFFALQDNPITASDNDVDYTGQQKISAWYYMMDMPLNSWFNVLAGARYEDTSLSIQNFPDMDENGNVTATWIDVGSSSQIKVVPGAQYPDGPDVQFEQRDMLPSFGFVFEPFKQLTFRGSYSETVARQTFKELSPIIQADYLGGDVFIGNPDLKMSALKNYDLRMDYNPYEGGLFSMSWFKKEIKDPIEYVQGNIGFTYTYPVNYPEGQLEGWEFEIRQQMGHLWDECEGLTLGGNLTLIDSEVTLSADEAASFSDPTQPLRGKVPMSKRDMTNTPEHLYNIYAMYNLGKWGLAGTDLALFYTVRGDTLVAGDGQADGNYIPSVYETEYGTLNFSLSHKIGKNWSLKFQAKNLLDPDIETVYRSKYIGDDVTRTSYQKGREFSISLSGEF